ncbi:PEGA domain-containing protein [Candidatus Uabimicrobium sp. HlEnr_7]|uniref:PEGA domain-containing protein n=1 Tax=Candidatus Uabimicrobium helgolandensis TaxID=3095367 RepID=UPI003558079A
MPKNIILLLLATIFITSCCVKRYLNITSDPPNATVFIDGEKHGTTPAKVSFDFYGTREITLIKKGYHISTRLENVDAPFYQKFPIDFFVEFFVPIPIKDQHDFSYSLKPYTPMNKKQKESLLNRAQTHSKP